MTVKEIINVLEARTGKLPRKAIEEAIDRREEIIPELLKLLKKANKNIEYLREEENYFAHIYAMFLLAQFREKKAYKPVVALVSHPGEIPFEILGEFITEDLPSILASVSCGDISLIKRLIENKKINEYVRDAALRSLLVFVANNEKSRDEIVSYFKELFNKLEREHSQVWNELAACSCDLHPGGMYEEIEQAYKDGLVESGYVGLSEVQQELRREKGAVLNALRNDRRYRLIEDTIGSIQWWACFKSSAPKKKHKPRNFNAVPVERAADGAGVVSRKKIGRNEPCSCGSGRKYKRCCGK